MLSKAEKTAIIKEYARFEGDTGSVEVQVAVLTAQINRLTEHYCLENLRQIRYAVTRLYFGF